MRYTELKFNNINETVTYQDLKIQYLGDRKVVGSYGESIGRVYRKTNKLLIKQVIDNSQTVDVARIFIIQSDKSNSIILLGGLNLLRVNENLETKEILCLPGRDKNDEEYWHLTLKKLGNLMVCSYEAGLVFIDENLEILNMFSKKV